MNIHEAFPSNFLKAADLKGRTVTVTILRVEMEDLGDDRKPVLYFRGKDRGLVLNKTNANILTTLLGSDDTESWIGQRIQLYPTKVDFQGKRVDAIRVHDETQPRKAVPPPPPEPEDDDEDDEDEDVTF